MKFRILPIFLAAVFIATPSHSEEGDAAFKKYDLDENDVVTAKELPSAAIRARYDQDGDGDVTLAEYRRTLSGTPAPTSDPTPDGSPENHLAALKRLDSYVKDTDKNSDGKLSREETGGAEWFKRVDRNRDGFIGAGEIEVIRKLVQKFGERILPAAPENPVTAEEVAKVTSGPEILKPGDVGIGRRIPDFSFTDLKGDTHKIGDVAGERGLVIAMTSATCPVSKRLLPTLAELEETLAGQGISLVLVNAFGSETGEQISEQLADHSFSAPYVHDKDKTISRAIEAATTTEVFLIDAQQTLIYRGALNDQYGIDYSLDEARVFYLDDAVASLLKNESPSIAATAAPGCELDLGGVAGTEAGTDVSYHRDVARILQQNCVHCHHDGGIAPFALDDFDEVSDRARVIRRVVNEGTMPPWFAAASEDGKPSPWANDHSLSTRDRTDLLAWLNSKGKPIGDPADAPRPLSFPEEWSTGEPDLIVPLSKAYKIKATGFMPYQTDVVETELSEDKWVTGYEILPSERDVVHHVIVQVFEKGSKVRDRAEGAGGYWAAYVPGNGAVQYPEGFARKLPAGAKIHFQIHYTPSGKEKMERLKIGLHFADSQPKYEVKTLSVADRKLEIPPGVSSHEEGTARTVPFDIPAMSFMAHMHVRGSSFSYEITYPDGRKEMLLDIPRYDFNWQLRYELKTPKLLPRGSSVRVTGVFDNSAQNKANPDPTKTVKWGNQTHDEMLIGYIEYFVPISTTEVAAAD